jgi:hypothetical protein
MHFRSVHSWLILAALLGGTVLSGCSLVGLGVGAITDSREPRYSPRDLRQAPAIPLHAQVSLVLADSTRVVGRLEASRRAPDDEYAKRYAAWREALPDSVWLPAIGEPITLDLLDHSVKAGRFHGLTYRALRYQDPKGRTRELALDRIARLRGEGEREYPVEVIHHHEREGTLPIFWQLQIRSRSGKAWVDCERIATIEMEPARHGKRNLSLIGVGLDLTAFTLFLSAVAGMD